MRAVFGVISLLVVLLIVGTLVKKQMSMQTAPLPSLQTPAGIPSTNPASTQREQARQLQQQIKQTLETQMQTPRPMQDEAK